jgi:hypothetical protein
MLIRNAVGFIVKIGKVKYGPDMCAVTAGVIKKLREQEVKRPVWKILQKQVTGRSFKIVQNISHIFLFIAIHFYETCFVCQS